LKRRLLLTPKECARDCRTAFIARGVKLLFDENLSSSLKAE
jgi:hypothetical protein